MSNATCVEDGCQQTASKRGKCERHYQADRRKIAGPCTVDGCDTAQFARQWCHKHYRRWRSFGTTDEPEPTKPLGSCSVEGCGKEIKARGWCATHLQRWYRWGSTDLREPPATKTCRECNTALPREQFRTTSPVCETCFPAYQLAKHGPCKADGCQRVTRARGYCTTHLRRVYRRGTPDLPEQSATRVCNRCSKRLPRADFAADGICRACYPHHRQEANAKRLSRASGVRQSAQELRVKQDGRCAICGTPEDQVPRKRLHLDHDHTTQAVRGLLCTNCNTGLGQFKDDPKRLLSAIEYLKRAAS